MSNKLNVEKLKGSGFLKFSGILMIIGAIVTVACGLLIILAAALVTASIVDSGQIVNAGISTSVKYATLIIGAAVCLIGGIVELAAGILSSKGARKVKKHTGSIVWAIIVLVINIIGVVVCLISGGFAGGTAIITLIVLIVFAIVVPVIFLISGCSIKGNYKKIERSQLNEKAQKAYEERQRKMAEYDQQINLTTEPETNEMPQASKSTLGNIDEEDY